MIIHYRVGLESVLLLHNSDTQTIDNQQSTCKPGTHQHTCIMKVKSQQQAKACLLSSNLFESIWICISYLTLVSSCRWHITFAAKSLWLWWSGALPNWEGDCRYLQQRGETLAASCHRLMLFACVIYHCCTLTLLLSLGSRYATLKVKV